MRHRLRRDRASAAPGQNVPEETELPQVEHTNSPDRTSSERNDAYLVRVQKAAAITGLPASVIRKSFIAEAKRPKNVPPPPPHKRIGRSVYIIRDQLLLWV